MSISNLPPLVLENLTWDVKSFAKLNAPASPVMKSYFYCLEESQMSLPTTNCVSVGYNLSPHLISTDKEKFFQFKHVTFNIPGFFPPFWKNDVMLAFPCTTPDHLCLQSNR